MKNKYKYISQAQYDELVYEITEYPEYTQDILDIVFHGATIKDLKYCQEKDFANVCTHAREIKDLRNNGPRN